MSLRVSLVIGRIQIKVLNALTFLSILNFSFPRAQIQNLKERISAKFILYTSVKFQKLIMCCNKFKFEKNGIEFPTVCLVFSPNVKRFWTISVEKLMNIFKSIYYYMYTLQEHQGILSFVTMLKDSDKNSVRPPC